MPYLVEDLTDEEDSEDEIDAESESASDCLVGIILEKKGKPILSVPRMLICSLLCS